MVALLLGVGVGVGVGFHPSLWMIGSLVRD